MQTLNAISLFSGIGGLDLGIKMAIPNARTCVYVEIDPYCQRILEARMRDGSLDQGAIWDDITTFDGKPWCGRIGLISGGFPCQDISVAGKGGGIIGGKRSGLWREYARLLGEIRPTYVFIENVAVLLSRGLDIVLSDLAALGYDAEWGCFRASDVGAPQRRERVFILAYARCGGNDSYQSLRQSERGNSASTSKVGSGVARDRGVIQDDSSVTGLERWREGFTGSSRGNALGNAQSERCRKTWECRSVSNERPTGDDLTFWPPSPTDFAQWERVAHSNPDLLPAIEKTTEPYVRRMVAGVSVWVDPSFIYRPARLKALGNAVVPQCAELAFRTLAAKLFNDR